MIQLTTDVSGPLLELIRDDKAPIDAVEVGPWFSVQQIHDYSAPSLFRLSQTCYAPGLT